MGGNVIFLSKPEEWSQYQKKDKVLAFFTAPWSGQAHKIAPIIRDLAREYPHVNVVQLDLRQFEKLAKDWKVNSAPTILFLQNDQQLGRMETPRPYQLYDAMDKYFST